MSAEITPHLERVRIPHARDSVYKDECAYSFDTPLSDEGLYISLNSFVGFGADFVRLNFEKTGEALYLNVRKVEILHPEPMETEESAGAKPTVMGIGVEGGFKSDVKQKEYETILSLVILPSFTRIPLPDTSLPEKIQASVAGIVAAESASHKEDVLAWGGDEKKPSKHAETLVQLPSTRRLPLSGWKCDQCELTNNLWLNLTDGTVLCSRKNWDGTGGNNHAADHYDKVKYPLAVKLGTITPEGADVYCYPDDKMVIDTKLREHLLHFGIDMNRSEKTEMTIAEMEIDQNMKFEFNRIQEKGEQLIPLFGPGYTGLQNMGNSCYLNSVVQVLFALPQFHEYYQGRSDELFRRTRDPHNDLQVQLAKLANGLHSGRYSSPKEAEVLAALENPEKQPSVDGIQPKVFKALVGRGHQDFSTNQQQDAAHFLEHLFQLIERSEKGSGGGADPTRLFRFEVEERILCSESNMVSYRSHEELMLGLQIPVNQATNALEASQYQERKKAAEVAKVKFDEEPVRANVPFSACLAAFFGAEEVPGFYSTALGRTTVGIKSSKFRTFPKFLLVQMRKFTYDMELARPAKLDVNVDIPERLDLAAHRGSGLQAGETALPEGAAPPPPAPPAVEADPIVVTQLMDMGFGPEACQKAAIINKNNLEASSNWLLSHMEDADLNEPYVAPAPAGAPAPAAAAGGAVDESAVGMLIDMGVSRSHAIRALRETKGNMERAADWAFNHAEEPEEMAGAGASAAAPAAAPLSDGPGKYELIAFISHMGSSAQCGHYVCHIRKDGRWAIYNDQKVAVSSKPPFDLGYLYLYARID